MFYIGPLLSNTQFGIFHIFSSTLSDKITDVVRPLICLKFNIQATFVKSMFLSFNLIKNETFIHSVSVINFRPSNR